MSLKLIEKLRNDRAAARSAADEILSRYEESGEEFAAADSTNLEELEATATALDARISDLVTIETNRANAARIDSQFDDARRIEPGAGYGHAYTNDRPAATTLADLPRMVEASDLARYADNGAVGTAIMRTELTVIKSVDAKGNPLAPAQRIADAGLPTRRTPILDAIGYERLSVGNASWLEWPSKAPEAGVVAEDAVKPEAAYDPKVMTSGLDKYAHVIPITAEAIADNPRLLSVVQGAMTDGVRVKAERSAATVITTGVAGNPYQKVTATDLWKAIRLGIAKVQETDFVPQAILVNPTDWANIDIDMVGKTLRGLARDNDLWSLVPIPSFKVTAGTAYVGDFRTAFKFLDRADFQVSMTDSHANDFDSNRYRLRAEQRGKVVIERPEAIAACSVGTPASEYAADYTAEVTAD